MTNIVDEWWEVLEKELEKVSFDFTNTASPNADLDIDESAELRGDISIGTGTKVCRGAFLQGPIKIGANCQIGNNTMLRGPLVIEDNVQIGFSTELGRSVLRKGVTIGPQCCVIDSLLEENAYFGSLVRTSNHRLDLKNVSSYNKSNKLTDTGRKKLGVHIGQNSRLGIQCVVLPGRIVAESTIYGPRIIVEKNLPSGRYILKQALQGLENDER